MNLSRLGSLAEMIDDLAAKLATGNPTTDFDKPESSLTSTLIYGGPQVDLFRFISFSLF